MKISMPALAVALLGAAVFIVPSSSRACSLSPPEALLLKQMMAREIAFRLALDVEQVPLNDITAPALHRPWELGADCSGLAAMHHSSGFRIVVAQQQQHGFATMGKPHTAYGTGARHRARVSSGFYSGWGSVGIRRNLSRQPRPSEVPGLDYSGYIRWPQYPTERDFAQSSPAMLVAQRWPQYPYESRGAWPGQEPSPMRWSTMSVLPEHSPGQGFCRYEGVAVVLGYDRSSPVAVNFEQQCD